MKNCLILCLTLALALVATAAFACDTLAAARSVVCVPTAPAVAAPAIVNERVTVAETHLEPRAVTTTVMEPVTTYHDEIVSHAVSPAVTSLAVTPAKCRVGLLERLTEAHAERVEERAKAREAKAEARLRTRSVACLPVSTASVRSTVVCPPGTVAAPAASRATVAPGPTPATSPCN